MGVILIKRLNSRWRTLLNSHLRFHSPVSLFIHSFVFSTCFFVWILNALNTWANSFDGFFRIALHFFQSFFLSFYLWYTNTYTSSSCILFQSFFFVIFFLLLSTQIQSQELFSISNWLSLQNDWWWFIRSLAPCNEKEHRPFSRILYFSFHFNLNEVFGKRVSLEWPIKANISSS